MPSTSSRLPRLFDELRERRRDLFKTIAPAILVAMIGFLIAFRFVEPPPPKEIVIAAGPADGNYHAAAQRYAEVFAKNGVKLTIRETLGSVENYQLLLDDESVQLAIVQGGTAPRLPVRARLESLATLYLEPLWVFYRQEQKIARLSDLRGKRLGVGEDGSGTQMLSMSLLDANGVEETQGTVFVREGRSRTVEMLRSGELDVVFFVLSAEQPVIAELLDDENVALLNFTRSRAYAQRYQFLKDVVLAEGVVDLQRNLPRHDTKLIAPYAELVATSDLHDAFIPILLEAATQAHEAGGLVSAGGEHPSLKGVEFSPNPVARHYLKHGPSFLQKYLGFWLASLVDRTKILLLPFIILLIPLAKLVPPVYRWRIRSRIYRWYGLLHEIDKARRKEGSDIQVLRDKLRVIEKELDTVSVPLSYMEEFYHLSLHMDLVKRNLDNVDSDSTQSGAS